MKNVFKRNQIVITALAIMIAAAFYLNYAGKIDMKENSYQASSQSTTDDTNLALEISDEDIYLSAEDELLQETSSEDIISEEDILEQLTPSDEGDILSFDSEPANDTVETTTDVEATIDTATADTATTGESTDTSVPGEAVLTSGTTVSTGFIAEAKLSREQVRSKNKETLMEIINNAEIAQEQKQTAIDAMLKLTEISEKEAATEILLESKGFENVVVSIVDDTADVVVGINELSDAKRAQIEDIMKRKTGVSPENIVITPVAVESK